MKNQLLILTLLCAITQGALAATDYDYAEASWNGTEVQYTYKFTGYNDYGNNDYDVLSVAKYGYGGDLWGVGSGHSEQYKSVIYSQSGSALTEVVAEPLEDALFDGCVALEVVAMLEGFDGSLLVVRQMLGYIYADVHYEVALLVAIALYGSQTLVSET